MRLDTAQRSQIERQLRLLHARLDLAKGNPDTAIPVLQAVIVSAEIGPTGQRSREWIEASRLLAQVYAGLGQWDKAAEYYDDLAQVLPAEIDVVVPTVDAHLKSGRYADALQTIDNFARYEKPTGELLLQRVQALLALQSKRAPADRNWTEFQAALKAAKAEIGDRWQLVFAEIDYLLTQSGDKQAAAALLRQAEPKFPDQVDFWRTATQAYQILGMAEDRQRALTQHGVLAASPVDQARLQAALL